MDNQTEKNSFSIAGMSIGGGRKENFFICTLEYFENEKRWFLSSLKDVKQEVSPSRDEVITQWLDHTGLHHLIVDFPLTKPICETCELECPGVDKCAHETVEEVRNQMSELLKVDKSLRDKNPKKYEQDRNIDDEVKFSESVLEKNTTDHILSKAFKRKLKKGFTPYWNRPLDFWVWENYYDQLLKSFDISYDSFGNVSVMLLYKFRYLMRHLPKRLDIYEANIYIVLLELFRAGIISKKHLIELQDIQVNTLARVQVTRAIEEKLGVFIYKKDLDLLSKKPQAFYSFLLAIAGKQLIMKKVKPIPKYKQKANEKFIVPDFVD